MKDRVRSTATLLASTSLFLAGPAWAQGRPLPTAEELRGQPRSSLESAAPAVDLARPDAQATCPRDLTESPVKVSIDRVDPVSPTSALPSEVRATIDGAVSTMLGGARPARVLCDIRDRANVALSEAGYVAVVQVPENALQAGVLRLNVTLARVVAVDVIGTEDAAVRAVGARLKELQPFNEREAEALLLNASDGPGLKLRLALKAAPGGAPGDVTAVLTVDRVRAAYSINAQNYGSKEVGRESVSVQGEWYGLTGRGDRTSLGLFTTGDLQEQRLIRVGHDFAVGAGGLRFGAAYAYALTEPSISQGGVALDVESRSSLGSVFVAFPFVRSLDRNLGTVLSLEAVDQKTRVIDIPVTRDKISVVSLRLDADRSERVLDRLPSWRFAGGVELRKGLDAFGAMQKGEADGTALPSRPEGDPEALVLKAEASGAFRRTLGDGYTAGLAVDARGQYADDPLVQFEEFAVGNYTIGRGYDPGVTSGDRALGAQFEARVGRAFASGGRAVGWEAFAFYDVVRVDNLDAFAGPARKLESVGGGFRVGLGRNVALGLTYARPLDRAAPSDAERADDRLLVSLSFKAFQ